MKPASKISLLPAFFILLFILVILRRAWMSDDAYITFRTIDNFRHGYGLVWNVGERVQAYTHPLWMFLILGLNALTNEFHFTSIVVSILVSTGAVVLFATRLTRPPLTAALGILALTLSKAYVDYSTSGLENPLSHLLLILFVYVFLHPHPQREFRLAFLTSLILLTRLDLALVVAPPLLLVLIENHRKPALRAYLAGALPLLVWEGFSLFYYGFPLPNTFYAKLSTGIPQAELTRQGLQYLLNALEFDPLTLLLTVVGLLSAFQLRSRKTSALALGILLYLVYVIRIGGDFMAGRFLTTPLLIAVLLLTQLDFDTLPVPQTLIAFGLIVTTGLIAPNATLNFRDTDTLQTPTEHVDHRGISDERLNYAPFTAPLALPRNAQPPTHVWAWQGTRDAGRDREFATKFGIGFYGFNAGPGIYIIDQLALADPLLARLPAARDIHWRVGHYIRDIPTGYERTLEYGSNTLKDPNLARYYDILMLITRGPLASKTRLLEIVKMNLGLYDDLIDWDTYRHPELIRIPFDEKPEPPAPETPWDATENVVFPDSGLEISVKDRAQGTILEISLSSDDDFLLSYRLNGKESATQILRAAQYPEGGLAIYRVFIPMAAEEMGFDAIRILPIHGENFSMGHLRFLSP